MSSPLWPRFSADPRSNGQVRASDADRAVVSDVLSEAFALGQIDPDEFDERIDAASSLKTLGEIPDLLNDLVIDEEDTDSVSMNEAARAQALARLKDERVPITPEQIDEAARLYYRHRVRRALLGTFAGPVGITLAIWAISSIASGGIIFFWPIFVILPTLFGAISHITGKEDIIRNRKRELTKRAKAHLGDVESQRQLGAGGTSDTDDPGGPDHMDFGSDIGEDFDTDLEPDFDDETEDRRPRGLPPHPFDHPFDHPFAPGHQYSDENRRRGREQRDRRRDRWDY